MKKMFVAFAVALFLLNPAVIFAYVVPKKANESAEKGRVDGAWKFIISTPDKRINILYRIEGSELVLEFINLNHDKNAEIRCYFRVESKIGWETRIFEFFPTVTAEKNRITYAGYDMPGTAGSARITLFKIFSVR